MAVSDVYKLRLESIASGGEALGRFEGKTVFVDGGAPNETALVRVTQEKKNWARAQLLEIIEPSPFRVYPVCTYYKICGGCSLQHISYKAQIDAKLSVLKESILKIAGMEIPKPEIVSYNEFDANKPWEYRNRMQFHCLREKTKNSKNNFGLMGRQSGEIIPVSNCPVAAPGIQNALKSLRLPPEKDRFTVFSKDNVLLSEGAVTRGKIKLLDKEIILDAGVFFQSNCFMLEKLIFMLREIAGASDRNLPMADLYCGIGTFAFFLSDLFPAFILAEENKTAVSIARENLRGMNAQFFAIKDNNWPKTILNKKNALSFAVIDPPRAGLNRETAAALSQNGPPLLAYVSCDAASLARDAKILSGGYELKRIVFFDFYPQTAHIESLAVFGKS